MKLGKFIDTYRGDGIYFSVKRFTIALRLRLHFYYIEPQGKPGYKRLYLGPFEFEIS